MEYRATLKLPAAGEPGVPPPDGVIPAVNQTFHPTPEKAAAWAGKVLAGNPGAWVLVEKRDWEPVQTIWGPGAK